MASRSPRFSVAVVVTGAEGDGAPGLCASWAGGCALPGMLPISSHAVAAATSSPTSGRRSGERAVMALPFAVLRWLETDQRRWVQRPYCTTLLLNVPT